MRRPGAAGAALSRPDRRADTWRQRRDTTTNWAVMLTAALLTWIFSSPSHPHYVLLVGMVAATLFLLIFNRRAGYQDR